MFFINFILIFIILFVLFIVIWCLISIFIPDFTKKFWKLSDRKTYRDELSTVAAVLDTSHDGTKQYTREVKEFLRSSHQFETKASYEEFETDNFYMALRKKKKKIELKKKYGLDDSHLVSKNKTQLSTIVDSDEKESQVDERVDVSIEENSDSVVTSGISTQISGLTGLLTGVSDIVKSDSFDASDEV